MRPGLERVRRVVVKIGSSSLTHKGKLSSDKMRVFAQDIASLRRSGIEVIIVSSGAISAGCGRMKCPVRAVQTIPDAVRRTKYRYIGLTVGVEIGRNRNVTRESETDHVNGVRGRSYPPP